MENLNLWTYLKEKYGMHISYSDSGWKVEYKGQTMSGGDVVVGMAKRNIGMRQDPKQLNTQISNMLTVLYGTLCEELHADPVLREKYATMKVNARRRARNG